MDLSRHPVLSFLFHCVATAVILAAMAGMFLLWVDAPQESTEDSYIVTIDYDCRAVLQTPDDWPEQVLAECRSRFTTLPAPDRPTT